MFYQFWIPNDVVENFPLFQLLTRPAKLTHICFTNSTLTSQLPNNFKSKISEELGARSIILSEMSRHPSIKVWSLDRQGRSILRKKSYAPLSWPREVGEKRKVNEPILSVNGYQYIYMRDDTQWKIVITIRRFHKTETITLACFFFYPVVFWFHNVCFFFFFFSWTRIIFVYPYVLV